MRLRYAVREAILDLVFGPPCRTCWQRRCKMVHQTRPATTREKGRTIPPAAARAGWVQPVVEAEAERIAAIIRQQMEAQLAAAFARTTPTTTRPDLLAPWLPTVEHTVPKDL